MVSHSLAVDRKFIDNLSLKIPVMDYHSDIDFTPLRMQMLTSGTQDKYILLTIGFFIDVFYKAQVFNVKIFLQQNGIKPRDFLSDKAKKFMESI